MQNERYTTLEHITALLSEIQGLEKLCTQRCLEKMNATGNGFGAFNRVESIAFTKDGATITVVDSGYDLRDTAYESIDIEEILMCDSDWKVYLIEIEKPKKR